jgi:hypothetical protein
MSGHDRAKLNQQQNDGIHNNCGPIQFHVLPPPKDWFHPYFFSLNYRESELAGTVGRGLRRDSGILCIFAGENT